MNTNSSLRSALAAATLAGASLGALAQAAATDKSVVPEPVFAGAAFEQWVTATVQAQEPVVPQAINTVTYVLPATAPTPFEPSPVILGLPELPLLGEGARQAARLWSTSLNYQGVHVRLLVLDASGRQVVMRPMTAMPRPGERFKLRVTTTFTAVSEVGLVTGVGWSQQRAGQLYPTPGMSVKMDAGETVDLPLEANRFFVMGPSASERLLLSVRHLQAIGSARSTQPAYRQDGAAGSSYLQLVPAGMRPAVEQLITLTTR